MGQQGTLTRIWARRGTRPRAPRGTRYQSAYLFGAVCPARGVAAGLVLPTVNTEAMSAHLAEISRSIAPGAHGVLILDGAGWHGAAALVIPDNLSLLTLPPYSPEPCVAKNSPPDCFLNAPHQSKTSGNTCGQTGSPSASSIPTKPSSRPVAKPGTASPTNRKSSPQ